MHAATRGIAKCRCALEQAKRCIRYSRVSEDGDEVEHRGGHEDVDAGLGCVDIVALPGHERILAQELSGKRLHRGTGGGMKGNSVFVDDLGDPLE